MDIYTLATEKIAQAIKMTFDIQKDKLPYDKSLICFVEQSLGNNKYKVKRNGQFYNCSSLDSKLYQTNDKVLVLVPCNIYKNMIIMGKVE